MVRRSDCCGYCSYTFVSASPNMKTIHGFEVVQVGRQVSPVGAEQRIWNVHPPVKYGYKDDRKTTNYVMTSAVIVLNQPETYIFPCTEDGKVLDWGELPGSFEGGLHHNQAIMDVNHTGEWGD